MSPAMEARQTTLDGVLAICPGTVHEDFRGLFIETYNRDLLAQAGVDVDFVQDDVSVSCRGVLRGLHGDEETWKLVCCLYGTVYLVVLNWDKNSPQFKKWESFVLSDHNHLQLLIPPKFANGYVVLSDMAVFHYKQSTCYQPGRQFSVRWDDPGVGIWWPVKDPLLSPRDEGLEPNPF